MKLNSSGIKPYGWIINSDGRGLTESISIANIADASRKGKAYIVNTNFITVTTANVEYGTFYIKNNSTTDILMIDRIRTCGETTQKWKLYKNPTGGTLISTASAANIVNMNLNSGLTSNSTNYKGTGALTVTGGTLMSQWISPLGHGIEDFGGAIALGNNDSLALSASVTSLTGSPLASSVCVTLIFHFKSADEE